MFSKFTPKQLAMFRKHLNESDEIGLDIKAQISNLQSFAGVLKVSPAILKEFEKGLSFDTSPGLVAGLKDKYNKFFSSIPGVREVILQSRTYRKLTGLKASRTKQPTAPAQVTAPKPQPKPPVPITLTPQPKPVAAPKPVATPKPITLTPQPQPPIRQCVKAFKEDAKQPRQSGDTILQFPPDIKVEVSRSGNKLTIELTVNPNILSKIKIMV